MNEVKVSVIIPTYNAEKYIIQCIDSIINQTYSNIEIICIDDGSTDSTITIISQYIESDSRIQLLKQEHQYAGQARNLGMKHASGKYLLFLDADDFFNESMIEKAVLDAEKTQSDIVIWDGQIYDTQSGEVSSTDWMLNTSYLSENRTFSAQEISNYLYQFTSSNLWNKLFRNEFIMEQGIIFQQTKRANDVYFTSMALASAKTISILEDKLVFYRVNNQDSLQGSNKKDTVHFYEALYFAQEELKRRGLYPVFEQSFCNLCLVHCINELNDRKTGEDFVVIYQQLKNIIFEKLHLTSKDQDFYYRENYSNLFNKIQSKSAVDFLFDQWQESMRDYDKNHLKHEKQCSEYIEQLKEKIWRFPYEKIKKGSKVIIYGSGNIGKDYYNQLETTGFCNVILWVDKQFEQYRKACLKVETPDKIFGCDFDYLIIAIRNKEVQEEVRSYLLRNNLKEEKIIYSGG